MVNDEKREGKHSPPCPFHALPISSNMLVKNEEAVMSGWDRMDGWMVGEGRDVRKGEWYVRDESDE